MRGLHVAGFLSTKPTGYLCCWALTLYVSLLYSTAWSKKLKPELRGRRGFPEEQSKLMFSFGCFCEICPKQAISLWKLWHHWISEHSIQGLSWFDTLRPLPQAYCALLQSFLPKPQSSTVPNDLSFPEHFMCTSHDAVNNLGYQAITWLLTLHLQLGWGAYPDLFSVARTEYHRLNKL
jgi:hypothetical protein